MAEENSANRPAATHSRLSFSLRTMLLAMVAGSVLFAWRYDRQRLEERIEKLEQQVFPQSRQGRQGPPAWSTQQATGQPDTPRAGDIQTAWASATPDSQREWLIVDFDRRVWPSEVHIHETYNPGAVDKVSVFKSDGTEVVAWQGTDPTSPTAAKGVSKIAINVKFKINRVKIYLDSPKVAGWNEIDAVGLRDWWGRTHWAKRVRASSTYGSSNVRFTSRGSY